MNFTAACPIIEGKGNHMALELRKGEQIKVSANFHWSVYAKMILWAFFWLIFSLVIWQEFPVASKYFLAFGIVPLAYVILQNKFKTYVVTSERIYVEEGIIAKARKDISLKKVNDVTTSQSIIQRLLGAGNILIMTGNDNALVLKDIDNSERLRSIISELIEKR